MASASFDPAAEADRLHRRLEQLAARPTWGKEKMTLRIAVPNLRSVAREASERLDDADHAGVVELVELLWNGVTYDEMHLAVELLRMRPEVVDAGLIHRLRPGLDGRAVTDDLASVLREWVAEDPADRLEFLAELTGAGDPWSRRLGLLGTARLTRRGEAIDETLALVAGVLGDRRTETANAVSATLRGLARKSPQQVEAFVEEHADDIPALVRLEVWNTVRFGRKDGAAHQRRADRSAAKRAEHRRSGEPRRPSRRSRRRSGE